MPTYWSLPQPIKIFSNIFAFLLLFLTIKTIDPSQPVAILIFVLFSFILSVVILFFTTIETTFHLGIITILVTTFFTDFRFFVVLLATTALFFFTKTFTADAYSKYERQLKHETNKNLKLVLSKKVTEYKYWETFTLSIFSSIFLISSLLYLYISYQNGEVNNTTFPQLLIIAFLINALCLASLNRKLSSLNP